MDASVYALDYQTIFGLVLGFCVIIGITDIFKRL